MEKQTITIYDVAREANVSMATVSRVVNGNANVKPTTRKKVLEVIERLDYRPNAVARGLASKKTTTVGVIIPDVTDIYFSTLARGIDDIASMYKYNIILANSDQNAQKEIRVLNTLLAKQVDGIIYMGYRVTEAMQAEIKRMRTPVVLAGTYGDHTALGSVNIDYQAATNEAIAQLIKNGHQKIAFICNDESYPINKEVRLVGYRQALEAANLPYDESLIYSIPNRYTEAEALAQKLLDQGVTAALAINDEVCIGLMNGLIDCKVAIPDDFELIASENSKLTQMVRPSLTSIAPPLYDIGAVAMRLLTKIMNKEELDERAILLPYKIAERQSTK